MSVRPPLVAAHLSNGGRCFMFCTGASAVDSVNPQKPSCRPDLDWSDSMHSSSESIGLWSHVSCKNNRMLYYAGRPPWYDCEGNMKEAYIIGLCGGSASGKTTVARNILKHLNVPWVMILSLDSFYKVLTPEQRQAADRLEYDFDSPEALDFDLAFETIKDLRKGKKAEIPIYDYTTHSRLPNKASVVYGASVIVVEGLMTLLHQGICELLDLKIFVDTDADFRLSRRLIRDLVERGRDVNSILTQYKRFVKPNFDKYIAPLVKVADIVIPWDTYNMPAIEMIAQLVKRNLIDRGFIFRSELLMTSCEDTSPFMNKVHAMEQTNQVVALQTIIRNEKTDRRDFILHSKRLMKLCLIDALSLLPYEKVPITLVGGGHVISDRLMLTTKKKICVVSIMRAGEAFEDALASTLFEFSVGKLLIQTNAKTGEPEFHYRKLPSDINETFVILLDATIASGAAAIMAIRILKDHDVQEDNIIMATLILTPKGARAVLKVFPKVQIVTTAVDDQITNNYFIIPGFGNFGQRYFGS